MLKETKHCLALGALTFKRGLLECSHKRFKKVDSNSLLFQKQEVLGLVLNAQHEL